MPDSLVAVDRTHVPDGWRLVRLGDVASLRKEQMKPVEGDTRPYVALENIISEGSLNGYGKAGDSVSNKTTFCRGDTLYGKLRPNLRKVVRVDFDGVCSTDILAVFAHGLADARFLSHILRSDLLHGHAMRGIAGTKMPRTSWSHLRSFKLDLPPLPEQRAIAAVLDGIDEAIERTEAVIAATEHLRDALLHELLTCGVPGWHTEWRDVPGVGTVPASWEVVRLGDECERVTKGTTPTTLGREYTSAGVRFLRVENVSDDGAFLGGEVRFIDDATHRMLSRSILRTNDLVLSIAGALGRSALVTEDLLPANLNQALAIVRLAKDSRLAVPFMALTLRGSATQRQINDMRVELAQANISLQQVRALSVALPRNAEQRAITVILGSVAESIERAHEWRGGLQSLKASAADVLLLGRVRVKERQIDG